MIRILGSLGLALLAAAAPSFGLESAELRQIQSAVKLNHAGWVAADTSMMRLAPAERKRRLGALPPRRSKRSKRAAVVPRLSSEMRSFGLGAPSAASALRSSERPSAGADAPPPRLDWRERSAVTPVKDQGDCGSCWAFSTAGALESFMIIHGVPSLGEDRAVQVLLSCGGAGSCGGGSIEKAAAFIRSTGLPDEAMVPYTASDMACSSIAAGWFRYAQTAGGYSALPADSAAALKSRLAAEGPLATTMQVYGDFFAYAGGVYRHVRGAEAGWHAVLLVGYDDAAQAFIAKNSWGTGWGEKGFFRIAYSEMGSGTRFGAETVAFTAKPKADAPAAAAAPAEDDEPGAPVLMR